MKSSLLRHSRTLLAGSALALASLVASFAIPGATRAEAQPAAQSSPITNSSSATGLVKKPELPPQERELSWRDTIIVTGVRVLFRQTVELVDVDYLRGRMVEKLQKKNRKSYEKTMNRIFDDLDYLNVKEPLGLTRTSSKRETIRTIRRAKPEKVIAMVEEIPDEKLASWINKEVSEKGLESITEIRDYIYERVEKFVAEYTG